VAVNRGHTGSERGTSWVYRTGRLYPLTYIQRKRNLALLRKSGRSLSFDRRDGPGGLQLPTRMLLYHGAGMSRRLLAYNTKLLLLSKPPHFRYALFQQVVRLLGAQFVRM